MDIGFPMSKKATAKTIPREILDLVRQEFNASGFSSQSRGTGKWSFIPQLQKALTKFVETLNATHPDLVVHYPKGPTEDLLRRAFNLKSPPGATRSLRDLLCLYATNGTLDWDAVILQKFADKYSSLLDTREKSDTPIQASPASSMDFFVSRMAELLAEKLSPREIEIVKRQIMDETGSESLTGLPSEIDLDNANDPDKPEFPPKPFYTPSFPATQTRKIEVPGFTNVWVKDESINPTGTHKDRMAWEVLLKAKRYHIREISLISSGSAATAIQHFFNLYNVPTILKVLVDQKINPEIRDHLVKMGCKVYETDLSQKPLTGKEIKDLTENQTGIDITYREILDRYNDNYYDWLSYEILNEKPAHCFIPFGTGDLFINVLIIAEREFNNRIYRHDPRFFGDAEMIRSCNFLGATTHHEHTRLDKLFSYYLPSLKDYNGYLSSMISNDRIGSGSGILDVEEEFVEEAIAMAHAQGIQCEPSGIAGLSLLLQNRSDFPPDDKILIVNTGKTKYDIGPDPRIAEK